MSKQLRLTCKPGFYYFSTRVKLKTPELTIGVRNKYFRKCETKHVICNDFIKTHFPEVDIQSNVELLVLKEKPVNLKRFKHKLVKVYFNPIGMWVFDIEQKGASGIVLEPLRLLLNEKLEYQVEFDFHPIWVNVRNTRFSNYQKQKTNE